MWTISLYLKYDHLWRILENQPGFPSGTSGKEHTCQCRRRDMGLIPGSGRSPGGEHGNPLQYSCLKNLRDRGTWWATIHRVTKSRTRLKQLSTHACGKPTIILKLVKGKIKYLSCMNYIEIVRILEWVAFPFSRRFSQPRDWTQVSWIASGLLTSWATGKPKNTGVGSLSLLQRSSQPRNQTGVS